MADNPTMKTLTIDGVTYEIYDDVARSHIANIGVKTADMTQPVGIDADGKLWTVPSAGGAGLTEAQIAALDDMFKIAAYTEDASDAYSAFKAAFGIDDPGDVHTHSYTSAVTTAATCTTAGVRTYTCSCGESYTEEIPATGHSYDEGVATTPAACTETGVKTFTCSKCGETYTEEIPATGHSYVDGVCTVCGATDPTYNPDVTLSSISATYSGGSVPVGTSVTDLTGITVTAHYSDGTSEPVTGYTLSGTIAEGSNTITVSYGGKTTTFVVTGVAESGGDEPDEPDVPEESEVTLIEVDSILVPKLAAENATTFKRQSSANYTTAIANLKPNTKYKVVANGTYNRFRLYGHANTLNFAEVQAAPTNTTWSVEQIYKDDDTITEYEFNSGNYRSLFWYLIGAAALSDLAVTVYECFEGKVPSSISATYTGGDVAVGTAISELTGIVVTATYSDGTSEPVTGYTLSGNTIAEGRNTIAVSYGGKTTTFIVICGEPIDTSPVIAEYDKGLSATLGTINTRDGICYTQVYRFEPDIDGFKASEYYDAENDYSTSAGASGSIKVYTPNTKYVESGGSTSGMTTSASKIWLYQNDTPVHMFSNSTITMGAGGTPAEINTQFPRQKTDALYANGIAFTLTELDADDSYAYWYKVYADAVLPLGVSEGDIIFAGKNTKYYGMSNISQYAGA